jgi:hypothetical protein
MGGVGAVVGAVVAVGIRSGVAATTPTALAGHGRIGPMLSAVLRLAAVAVVVVVVVVVVAL